jgi:hypothetical protein
MILRLSFAALIAAALAGCFSPSFADHLACGPGGACPPGRTCVDAICRAPDELVIDAPVVVDDPIGADAAAADAAAADAAPDARPDAAPVGCQGDPDCATPPDKCSTAGTCDLGTHMCRFPAVSCTQLDGDCTVGACDPGSGACVAMPRHEGNSCGAGTSCGPFGPCGFADACAENGTQSRACTSHTCHAGACVGASTTDTAACQRGSTDGATCGSPGLAGCDVCGGFTSVCDETGTQACTCTQPICANGTCSGEIDSPCTQGCTRDTDGLSCGPGKVCDAGGCVCPTC